MLNKIDILKILYIEKDYSKLEKLLNNSNDIQSFNILGGVFLREGNLQKAYYYFDLAKNLLGCGYCKFLEGDISQAEVIMTILKNSSPLADWILFLINLLRCDTSSIPSYFQIKNFYEQDLEMLFALKKEQTAEKIIKKNNILEKYNREIYKMTARVLINNRKHQEAQTYLKKSIDICYKDPETHFLLGEIYVLFNQKEKGIKEFQKCIEVAGRYLPAENRLKILSK